jgi:SAM-dependent methyltransferase
MVSAWSLPRIRQRLTMIRKTLHVRELAVSAGSCPACGPTLYVRFFAGPFGVRCGRCGAAANTISIIATIRRRLPALAAARVLLNSRGGPFSDWIRRSVPDLTTSGYFEGKAPGELVAGIRHENLEALSFDDAEFDLIANQEVFEHVGDDGRAFREALRVLKPGGALVFTVPLPITQQATIERARLESGKVVHLTEPEYHNEPSGGKVLAFRSYGLDIAERLRQAGFALATVDDPRVPLGRLGLSTPVVFAQKAQ